MDELISDLEYTLAEVNEVIEAIKMKAVPEGINPYQLQNMSGEFTLAAPLHTKALLLSALIPLRRARDLEDEMEKAKNKFLDAIGMGETPKPEE